MLIQRLCVLSHHDPGQQRALPRRTFLGQVLAGAAGLAVPGAVAAEKKPNIVVIVADDMGWGEICAQGFNKDIPTPNIDSIAQNGVRFTNGYVTCPVCSPTRAGIMTGRYQQRFGHEFNGTPVDPRIQFGLPLTETTLADRLKALGYTTGAVGKWHLGSAPQFHPLKRGFDEFYGFLGGARSYYPTDRMGRSGNPILQDYQEVPDGEHTTDEFSRAAASFVDRHKDNPFFLYLAFNAVHAPMQTTAKYFDRFRSIKDTKRRVYAGMESAMDDGVGGVLSKLRQYGLEEDTLVIFISDNGGEDFNASSNGPLRGEKRDLWEGGIRETYLMQWKRRLPKGKVYDQMVSSLDICPTVMAAAGGMIPASAHVDGVDLTPYLTGQRDGIPHEILYWRHLPEGAVRKGDWKLVMLDDGSQMLFNLAEDIGESNDLALSQPAKVKELRAAWDAWSSQLARPLYRRFEVTRMRRAMPPLPR